MSQPRRVAFLDRDGVLTVPNVVDAKGYAVRRLEDLALYPDAAESVRRLRAAGFDVVVVTNQPDIANGAVAPAVLAQMHEWLMAQLDIARIHTCPHGQTEACACRKPKPGLLLDEAAVAPVDFEASWIVGDRDSDIAAGKAVGCHSVFIARGWAAESGEHADAVVTTLTEAVDAILSA